MVSQGVSGGANGVLVHLNEQPHTSREVAEKFSSNVRFLSSILAFSRIPDRETSCAGVVRLQVHLHGHVAAGGHVRRAHRQCDGAGLHAGEPEPWPAVAGCARPSK